MGESMMEQLKVALIGLGQHMQRILFPALCDCHVQVTAVCDADLEKAEKFALGHNVPKFYQDAAELCAKKEEVEAVVCAANSSVHYQVARIFAEKGVPVFIEKTPCDTRVQAHELALLEKEHRTLIQTGFNRRFATGYVMAKDLTEKEEFGRKTMFFSKFNASPYGSERFLLTNHLLHHLDLARFFLGELRDLHLRRVGYDEHRVGFQLDAVSEEGVVLCIQSNSLQDINYPMERVEITGVGHLVVVDNMRSLQYHRPAVDKSRFENARMRNDADALCWDLNLGFPFINQSLGNEDEIRHFIRCVRGECKPEQTFADTVKSMDLLYDVLDLYDALIK